MGRPPKPEAIAQEVDRLWVDEVKSAQEQGRKPHTVRVWRSLHGNKYTNPTKHGQKVSLSYVEKRIRENPGPGAEGLPVFEFWRPWVDPQETPEDRAFLLVINAARTAEAGLGLLQYEAEWGRKLRVALEGLSPYGQFRIVEVYGRREYIARYFKRETIYTADMDGLVAYKPWLPENRYAPTARWIVERSLNLAERGPS